MITTVCERGCVFICVVFREFFQSLTRKVVLLVSPLPSSMGKPAGICHSVKRPAYSVSRGNTRLFEISQRESIEILRVFMSSILIAQKTVRFWGVEDIKNHREIITCALWKYTTICYSKYWRWKRKQKKKGFFEFLLLRKSISWDDLISKLHSRSCDWRASSAWTRGTLASRGLPAKSFNIPLIFDPYYWFWFGKPNIDIIKILTDSIWNGVCET